MLKPPTEEVPPPPEPTPMTDQALARLRALAEGNGLAPEKIETIEVIEKVYDLDGVTVLTPFCDMQNARYAGPIKGKERTMMGDPTSMQAAAEQHQKSFVEGSDWVPLAMKELESAPGGGWGLDGAKISLPEKSKIFASIEICTTCEGRKTLTCPQCQGQAVILCIYCEGRGQELCYNCGGRGTSPANPNQPCVICQGKRYSICRWCHNSSGKLTCPSCTGRRVIPCTTCRGIGGLTLEIGLACGANINFRFTGKDLPSGARRGIDKLGVSNLLKGHADIKVLPPEKPEEDQQRRSNSNDGRTPEQRQQDRSQDARYVRYAATMPYADVKMRFGDARGVLIGVFGKRGSLLGVPAFLDESLKPWRDKLRWAGHGNATLESALEARVMRDALALELGGHAGDATALRKIYPVGLSPKTAQEIMTDMRHARHRYTRHIRLFAAIVLALFGAALTGGFFYLPQHAQYTHGWPWWSALGFDAAILGAVMAFCWISLSKSVQFVLQKKFPGLAIAMRNTAGHIGKYMLGGIFAGWVGALIIAPAKPIWLLYLLALVKGRL